MVVRITRSDIEDILDYRAAFEAGMLRQVIDSIEPHQLAELEEIDRLCTGEEAIRDFWKHWEYKKKFHLAVSYTQLDVYKRQILSLSGGVRTAF